jgi:hypothetical protein
MVAREDVRRIAASLDGTQEHAHFGALSFKRKKIFAVLREEGLLTLGLHPDDQQNLLQLHPDVLTPVAGRSAQPGGPMPAWTPPTRP